MNNQQETLSDIKGERDIRILVDSFYEGIRSDPMLGPLFKERVRDWSKHLPTMCAFWTSLLFGSPDYKGNPFAKHVELPVEKKHFDRWLELFTQTVDRLFEGSKADQAKGAAKSIAHSFQVRMGIDPFGGSERFF